MEYHESQVKRACRVCGCRLCKPKGRDRKYLVTEHKGDLARVFDIEVSQDEDTIHPPFFCHSCRVFMRTWGARPKSAPAVGRVFAWEKHSGPHCMVNRSAHISPAWRQQLITGLSPLSIFAIRREADSGQWEAQEKHQ